MKQVGQYQIDFSGAELRDAGIDLAVSHAESVNKDWKEITWNLFKEFLKEQKEPFLMEEFRGWVAMNHPDYPWPPSLRAFGGTVVRAKHEKLIKTIGTRSVNNPKAHRANASLLMKIS